MAIREQIQADMYAALKEKMADRVSVLRGVMSDIKNQEIDKKAELTDAEVVVLIRKQVKTLTEAKEMFLSGGREDLAADNDREMEILKAYLPKEISDADLETKVRECLAKHNEVDNPGRLIGLCVRELSDLADSGRVAATVRRITSA